METPRLRPVLSRILSDYGMLLVLVLLAVFFSAATLSEQHPSGAEAGRQVARRLSERLGPAARILVAARDHPEDSSFVQTLIAARRGQGCAIVSGEPRHAREALETFARKGELPEAIACPPEAAAWSVFEPETLARIHPGLARVPVVTTQPYLWPTFLKRDNLLNVANQIAVIAILAIGMTIVILTGGIDLSVGSLIALSAVVAARLLQDFAGGESAGAAAMVLASLAAIGVCVAVGLFSGAMVTLFSIPPFIVTLAMMLVASGLAFLLAKGQSIYTPPAYVWLGRGTVAGLPVAVLLMLLLYAAAHVLMTRTTLGRYICAVGGNAEAAWLSGVPVRRVLLFAYALCGALAGLGGVVTASLLKSGAPQYGLMYELYVIAAVVVGGTSLAGGEGRILGTLIGAFIIAVIQNGMNLTRVEAYTQKVVLGLVILAAVMLDILKRRGFQRLRK
jgi:ribose transport system permease protein